MKKIKVLISILTCCCAMFLQGCTTVNPSKDFEEIERVKNEEIAKLKSDNEVLQKQVETLTNELNGMPTGDYSCFNVNIGSTENEVIASLDNYVFTEEESAGAGEFALRYIGKFFGKDCHFTYLFENNVLSALLISPINDSDVSQEGYDYFLNEFIKYYGELGEYDKYVGELGSSASWLDAGLSIDYMNSGHLIIIYS